MISNLSFTDSSITDIFIPPSVTQIGKGAFSSCNNLKSITFSSKSNLEIIESHAFAFSSLETITIPSKVNHLNEDWFQDVKKLTKIIVSPENKRFSYVDDKYLLYKSDDNEENFDVFVFARRDIIICIR